MATAQDAPEQDARDPAQDTLDRHWSYNAELSLLFTSGNTSTRTFSVGGGASGEWESFQLSLTAGGLRTESRASSKSAVGSPDDFVVAEESVQQPRAENYFVKADFERPLRGFGFLTAGTGWERNTFAGFESRITAVAGLGNSWIETESTEFKTDAGVTLTIQEDVVPDPAASKNFGGLRLSTEVRQRLAASSSFGSALLLDLNLADRSDLRADLVNALVVDVSELLAVKTSVRFVWDNQPALIEVPLEWPAGAPTGAQVSVPRRKLDSTISVALVANF